jgi:hypothetical protein
MRLKTPYIGMARKNPFQHKIHFQSRRFLKTRDMLLFVVKNRQFHTKRGKAFWVKGLTK